MSKYLKYRLKDVTVGDNEKGTAIMVENKRTNRGEGIHKIILKNDENYNKILKKEVKHIKSLGYELQEGGK